MHQFSAVLLAAGVASSVQAAGFLGSRACESCHVEQFQAWRNSHHDLAMQHASSGSVLGDFDEATFTYGKVTTTFLRRDGEFLVRTDGPDGAMGEFRIGYTFGVAPLQQYLVEFPDGRLQALGVAWDTRPSDAGGQRWFHLYPDDDVGHDDELHWTRPQQNWNHMCAGCHSTNVEKGYDAAADTFRTTWSEVDVGCEACHGPGADHVSWAAQPASERSAEPGTGLRHRRRGSEAGWSIDAQTGSARPRPESGSGEVEVCADCHSRRSELAAGAAADPRFLNHFMPALLTEGLYHADGQIDDEVFVWGSFEQSRMHQAGVVCSDCHEPHGLRLKAPGSQVCARCHLPQRFDTEAHHRHTPGDPGASCIDCHMPERTYMVVDRRRDHSIRIPRPDWSVAIGTPNACNACHRDRDAAWAAGHHATWYPDPRPGRQTWAAAFALARAEDPAAETALTELAGDPAVPSIARATAVHELARFLSVRSLGVLDAALHDENPLIRMAGIRGLSSLPPEERWRLAGHLADDPLLAVRAEAGRALAATPASRLTAEERRRLDQAVDDYVAAQRHNADRPEAYLNLGAVYRDRGQPGRAEAAFRRSMAIEPGYVPGYVNLADLLRARNRPRDVVGLLREGLALAPEAAALHHALGLALVRQGETDSALAALRRARTLAPEHARFGYVYAIALNSTGNRTGALATLEDTLSRHPFDRDVLMALATINADAGDVVAARRYVERLLEARPHDQQVQALDRALESQR